METECIVGYCKADDPDPNRHYSPGQITDWFGTTVIGRYEVVSAWKWDGWMSSHRYAIRATVNGKEYHGRTFGHGMCVSLHPYKNA